MRWLGIVVVVGACAFQPGSLPSATRDATLGDGATYSPLDTSSPPDARVDATSIGGCGQSCTSEGGICNASGACVFDCGPAACASTIDCPPGIRCEVNCSGNASCAGGVNCDDASECLVNCMGDASCANAITCGANRCTVTCAGEGSCSNTTNCDNACACTVTCTGGDSCDGGADCPHLPACDTGPGCSALPALTCDACP